MKLLIPAAALLSVVLLSSCSSMYRSSQTPDDVYFSPGQPAGADVSRNRDRNDEYAYVDPDDNYLRQKVQNRNRWSTIDDADYWYSYNRPYSNLYGYNYASSPYFGNSFSLGFGNYYGFNNFGGYPFWNTWGYGYPGYYNYPSYGGYYGHGGGYYGGYYPGTVIVGSVRSNTGPKPYMGGYTNQSFNNSNNGSNGRNSSSLGRFIRNTTDNSNRYPTYNNNSNTPSRSFTPSTQSSFPSSSGGSSSGGARSGGSSSSSAGSRGGRGSR